MQNFNARDASVTGLDKALEKYLRDHGLVRTSRASQVGLVWVEVVGEWYAKHTEVLRMEQGICHVRCDSASRAQQLQLDAPQIIKALNKQLGPGTVKEIRPSSGGIRRRSLVSDTTEDPSIFLPARSELDLIELLPGERQWVQDCLATLPDDEEIRRRLEGVLVMHCKSERWKLDHGYRPCEGCGALLPPPKKLCKACDPGRLPQQGSTDIIETWDT